MVPIRNTLSWNAVSGAYGYKIYYSSGTSFGSAYATACWQTM
ncbi:MAG: hypothetical protein R3B47_05685 [Bacteroidia bacterium]